MDVPAYIMALKKKSGASNWELVRSNTLSITLVMRALISSAVRLRMSKTKLTLYSAVTPLILEWMYGLSCHDSPLKRLTEASPPTLRIAIPTIRHTVILKYFDSGVFFG